MPAKTGGSHAVAAFVTLIVGTTMSKYIWEAAPPLGEASVLAIEVLGAVPGIEVPATNQMAGALVLMVGLSFLWGVVYHVGRHS